ncbi:unnamed protein product [Porites lobata]|uniref:ATP-grasp domain-containing protein n=1 Tax=Porites lobata TaxID=104759 RepID=A0ABN8NGB6_9CNID|nr:unnamed protein product [Porites lobata]
MVYGSSFDDGTGSGKYSFSYALVRPDGTWSFVKKLSDIVDVERLQERKSNVVKMEITAALQHIKSVIKPDQALIHFPCLKGITTYRALFEALDIPLIGGSVESRYLSMDKLETRGVLLANNNVSCVQGLILNRGDPIPTENIKYPCVVKASKGEDSKSVRLVKDKQSLDAAIKHALTYSNQVIIERFIEGREIRCAVVKSEKTGDIQALSCMEYNVRQDDIRKTEDKLFCNEKGLPISKPPNAKTWFLDPAEEADLINRIQQQSRRVFQELDLQDFGLFDFRVDLEGNPFFLECNLFCSFGSQSVLNVIAKNSGFTDESLFDLMVQNALLRKEKIY